MSLEAMVGRQLVIGLPGPDATDDDIRLLREIHAGGLMLYRRNFETPERFVRFITRLEEGVGRRLLITTDHEGGRIIMLHGGVTIFPDNLTAGAAGDEPMVARQGQIEGRELRRLGVDVSFGPCLDVLTEAYSPNIGIRSYGKDPELVGRLGAARIRGMQGAGLSACAKHFPGKGHAPVDAHLGLPVIDSDWGDMHAVHLVPFMAAMEAGVDCVMTSHPVYPNLEPGERMPATFSKLIVHDYLRGQIGYRGVIISDDLEMGAISAVCPMGEAAVRTAAAGHDILLVCHTAPAERAAYEALLAAYRDKTLSTRELEKSMARLDALDAKRAERFTGGEPAAERDGEALARAMATRAVMVVAPPDRGWKPALNGRVAAIFPRLSSLAARITIEPAMQDEPRYVKEAMAPLGVRPEVTVVGVEPTAEEIAQAASVAAAADATVLFLYDAHLYPSNKALLEACQAGTKRLAVVLMRDPWDAELLAPGVAAATAYGWRRVQLDAVMVRLLT
jgi:beta-N-acetylhexosaminidase